MSITLRESLLVVLVFVALSAGACQSAATYQQTPNPGEIRIANRELGFYEDKERHIVCYMWAEDMECFHLGQAGE